MRRQLTITLSPTKLNLSFASRWGISCSPNFDSPEIEGNSEKKLTKIQRNQDFKFLKFQDWSNVNAIYSEMSKSKMDDGSYEGRKLAPLFWPESFLDFHVFYVNMYWTNHRFLLFCNFFEIKIFNFLSDLNGSQLGYSGKWKEKGKSENLVREAANDARIRRMGLVSYMWKVDFLRFFLQKRRRGTGSAADTDGKSPSSSIPGRTGHGNLAPFVKFN